MRILTLAGVTALLALPACMGNDGGVANYAGMSSGVGFGDYQRYLHDRESARRGTAPYSVAPEHAGARTYGAPSQAGSGPQVASQTAPIHQSPLQPAQPATGAPLAAPMAMTPPAQPMTTPQPAQTASSAPAFGTTPAFEAGPSVRPGLSDEQDFEAVAARETIESDRARLQQQRAQYQIVAVDSVPDASVRSGPNVVEYALATTHPVGVQQYRRLNPLRWSRWENACLQYHNQDAAQEAFLAAGGPERDRNNLDPDGDGYACWWDPTPYRQAMRPRQ